MLGVVALLALVTVSSAEARLVGEFDARVKDFDRVSGAYTVVADARIYDTAGLPVPALTQAAVRFPHGARLRREFLRGGFLCDPRLLERRPDPAVCAKARFATGHVVLDARPEVVESLPANMHLFLGRPAGRRHRLGGRARRAQRADARVRVPGAARAAAGRPGGRFGYRLELPTRIEPLLPTVTLTLAEIHLTCAASSGPAERGGGVLDHGAPVPARRAVSFGARYRSRAPGRSPRKRKVDCARLLRARRSSARERFPPANLRSPPEL